MDVFKLVDSGINGGLGNGVTNVKVATTEVTFDTNNDYSLSFFESSTPPPSVSKKEPEFMSDRESEGLFEAMTSDSLFSPGSIKKEDDFVDQHNRTDFSSDRPEYNNDLNQHHRQNSLGLEPMSTADYISSPFTTEESKYTSFSDTAAPSLQQTPPSPSPTLSPPCEGALSSRNVTSQYSKVPIIIKSG